MKNFSDVIIINQENKILLLQRSMFSSMFPGKWGLPGGHVDEGESFHDAAVRELMEETCIKLNHVQHVKTLNKPNVCINFYIHYVDSNNFLNPIIDSNEHINYCWVDVDNLYNYDLISDLRNVIEDMFFIKKGDLASYEALVLESLEKVIRSKKHNLDDSFENVDVSVAQDLCKSFYKSCEKARKLFAGALSYGCDVEDIYKSTYTDNQLNRRLGRAGDQYGPKNKKHSSENIKLKEGSSYDINGTKSTFIGKNDGKYVFHQKDGSGNVKKLNYTTSQVTEIFKKNVG